MKRILFILIIVLTLVGCNNKTTSNKRFNVVALNGPTGIGFVNMMEEDKHNFTLLSNTDEVVAGVVKGDFEIASIPANLASTLYNKNQDVSVVAINTLGVLYVVENGNTINSIEDLKGRTILSTGKGATPEYSLNYILEKAGIINDVTVEFKSEHSELTALLSQGKADIAVLPQPFVTTALEKNNNLRVALDLNEEWEKLSNNNMITGVLIVKNSIIENNKEDLDKFLEDYQNSINLSNNNMEQTAKLTEKYDILPENIAIKAIPECNIVYINNDEMKNLLTEYYNVLVEQNPKSIGGALPDEKFYYKN